MRSIHMHKITSLWRPTLLLTTLPCQKDILQREVLQYFLFLKICKKVAFILVPCNTTEVRKQRKLLILVFSYPRLITLSSVGLHDMFYLLSFKTSLFSITWRISDPWPTWSSGPTTGIHEQSLHKSHTMAHSTTIPHPAEYKTLTILNLQAPATQIISQ